MLVRKDGTEKTAKVDTLGELVEYGKEYAEGKAGYLKNPREYVPETNGQYSGVADTRAQEVIAGEIYSGNATEVMNGKSADARQAVREAQKAREKVMNEGPESPFQPSLAESTYGADYASAVRERNAERTAEADAQSGQDLQEAKASRRAARARAAEIAGSRDMSRGLDANDITRGMDGPTVNV